MAPERARGGAYSFPADVWALGLTLLEAATGSYPYDTTGGPLALLLALADDAPPRLAAGAADGGGTPYSAGVADFVAACLAKDPAARPTAAALAAHPWLAAWRQRDSGGGGATTRRSPGRPPRATAAAARSRSPSPDDARCDGGGGNGAAAAPAVRQLASGAADERPPRPPPPPTTTTAAATAVLRSLFAARALPSSEARCAALAPLYDGRAVLALEGRPPLAGARDVVAAVDAAAAGAASLGAGAPRLASLDVVLLAGGGALALATGTVAAPGPGPLAAARRGGGDGAPERPPRACSDAVTLAPCPAVGELRIVAHVFKTQF